ncbi:uncharacterized protein BDW43DRAFT_305678 [Aspergillus alliaceus]|uniref:uncharacterized protein n=1 Tax=Petromyces alliaceus TaxID=209559 RepID=UPI0012A7339E|nr:uncharacterized protein BDW43DRAFT_305678 [Aspergillus alliaceus]KAB8238774.1 hypothetical protein BDW43DRAFT_305678 [Aspergillus alliaceus]
MSSSLRSTYTGVTINSEGDFLCKCGYSMKDFTVQDVKSPYRGNQYWACRRHSTDQDRCKSWIWFDETTRVKRLVPRPATPQTPKKQTDIREFGHPTPPKSGSLKRKRVNIDPGTLDEPPGDDIDDSELALDILNSPTRRRQRHLRDFEVTPTPRAPFEEQQNSTDSIQIRPLRRFRTPPDQISNPSTPQRAATLSSGLFTPPTAGGRKHWNAVEAPVTPTKQRHTFASPACTLEDISDSDSYGCDDELVAAMLDSSDQIQTAG